MKKVLIGILASILLSACANVQMAANFTQTDLQNAVAIDQQQAMSMNQVAALSAQAKLSCDSWILANITTINMQLQSAPPVTGFFSGTSAAQAAVANFQGALSTQQVLQFNAACGAEVLALEGMPLAFATLGIIK